MAVKLTRGQAIQHIRISDNLADLFAMLYDILEPKFRSYELPELIGDSHFAASCLKLEEDLRTKGTEGIGLDLADGEIDPEFALKLLLAIDRAFGAVHPATNNPTPEALHKYRNRLNTFRDYSTDAVGGAVIPRWSYPYHPQDQVPDNLDGHLHHLWRVANVDPSIQYTSIDKRIEFPSGKKEIRVGCVPFIGDINEFKITYPSKRRAHWYEIKLSTDDRSVFAGRTKRIIERAEELELDIVLLPELCLNSDLLDIWQQALRRMSPIDGKYRLNWIIAGSGPVRDQGDLPQESSKETPPPNRAILLDRWGNIHIKQDKIHPFALTRQQAEKWGLEPPAAAQGIRDSWAEWMNEGRIRHVLDTSVGRFAIAICEDHGRVIENSPLREMGVSHVLVPLFSEPIRRYYWEDDAAQSVLKDSGWATIISNHCAVKGLCSKKNVVPEIVECGHAMATTGPIIVPVDKYPPPVKIKYAEDDPCEPLVFELPVPEISQGAVPVTDQPL